MPARPLGEAAALRVIAELAHDDGAGAAQETWPGLQLGGLAQATFRLHRWPDLRVETVPPAGDPDARAARGRDHASR